MAKKAKKKRKPIPQRGSKKGQKPSVKHNQEIIESVNKKYGFDVVTGKAEPFPVYFADTGSYGINFIICGRPLTGGMPGGRFTEVFGDPSTGKSIVIYKTMAGVSQCGGFNILDDSERSYQEYYDNWFDINVDHRFLLYSETIPEHFERSIHLYETIRNRYGDKMPIFIAADSLSMMMSNRERDEGFSKEDAGQRAKLIHSGMRQVRPYLQKDPLLVWVITMHKTTKFGDFFHQEDSTGGRGAKFLAATRLDLQERGKVKHPTIEHRVIGTNSMAVNKKSKLVSPFRRALMQILFDKRGLIREHGVFDLLLDQGILLKAVDGTGKQKTKGKAHLYCFSSDMEVEFTRVNFDSEPNFMKTGLEFLEAQEKFVISGAANSSPAPIEEENPTESDE